MPDASDMDLLRDYDRRGSERAFATLVQFLEVNYLKIPIIDQTGLIGSFDFNLRWTASWNDLNVESLKRALIEQLGLELVPSREPIETLVIEKAS